MKLSELRDALRTEYLDDVALPQLWSDDTLDRFINEACSEAGLRSRMIADSITVSLLAGQGLYELPTGTLDVTRCKLPGLLPIARTTVADLDASGNWEDRSGQTCGYAFMSKQYGGDGNLLIYPTPDADATAELAVVRMPAKLTGSAEPELPIHLHPLLLDWAAFRAFSLRDSDANDDGKAAKHEAMFTANFGRRLPAKVMPGRANRRMHRTKLNSDWS